MPTLSSAVFPPSDLWDYAVILYSQDEVMRAALALQDRAGADVNMLLFCIWAAARGRRLTAEEMEAAFSASLRWQTEVVRPLRTARRYLKSPDLATDLRLAGELRRGVADSELFAEHMQLLMLERSVAPPSPAATDPETAAATALAHLESYFRAAGIAITPEDEADLQIICHAAFPDAAAAGGSYSR